MQSSEVENHFHPPSRPIQSKDLKRLSTVSLRRDKNYLSHVPNTSIGQPVAKHETFHDHISQNSHKSHQDRHQVESSDAGPLSRRSCLYNKCSEGYVSMSGLSIFANETECNSNGELEGIWKLQLSNWKHFNKFFEVRMKFPPLQRNSRLVPHPCHSLIIPHSTHSFAYPPSFTRWENTKSRFSYLWMWFKTSINITINGLRLLPGLIIRYLYAVYLMCFIPAFVHSERTTNRPIPAY